PYKLNAFTPASLRNSKAISVVLINRRLAWRHAGLTRPLKVAIFVKRPVAGLFVFFRRVVVKRLNMRRDSQPVDFVYPWPRRHDLPWPNNWLTDGHSAPRPDFS